ncbi:hypothetical protein ABID25_005602 [Mesorhizobium abyssinicae]
MLVLLPISTSWSSRRWDFFGSCLLAFAFVALPRGSHDSSSGRLVLNRHRFDSASLPARVHLQVGDQPDTWMRTRCWSRMECAIKRRPFASALTSTLIAWQRKSFTAAFNYARRASKERLTETLSGRATSKSMGGPARFVASSYFLQPLKADAVGSGKLGPPARHPTQRGLSLSAYQHDDRQDERHLDFRLAHTWSSGRFGSKAARCIRWR